MTSSTTIPTTKTSLTTTNTTTMPTPTPTTTTAAAVSRTPLIHSHSPQTHRSARRSGVHGVGVSQQYPRHLLAYSLISIVIVLCWLPDFIVALKDVSVTIPQAVKRGSNAMLTCNYDMENDTLYSVKWYKGRREFYRYTPKENPAMKVFPSQSGLNVERNLSNQSHVVLLAVPLNISGKFTCEISVEAPSFQTAMVSGEMEVVELPEEQASVTGIQPRYRIGDLVDGNCSIKYSKPAANLTWTINGIVVPPHHIKTYQIEKYEETNLESVMSAIHFMVTTQHFIKGQMRLKCTASIFDIFKEEIESIIEEDRPRIMASGRSYDAHSYPHDTGEGYEDHNESYLTYFSAPKSSAAPSARSPLSLLFQQFHKLLLQHLPTTLSMWSAKTHICFTLTTFIINIERYYEKITQSDITTYCMKLLQQLQQQHQKQLIKLITVMAILLRIYKRKQRCHMVEATKAATLVEERRSQASKVANNNKITKKKLCNCNDDDVEEELRNVDQNDQERGKGLMCYKGSPTVCRCMEQLQYKTKHFYLWQQQEKYNAIAADAAKDVDDTVVPTDATTIVATAVAIAATTADDCQFRNAQCLAANQNVINEETTTITTTITMGQSEQQPSSSIFTTSIDCQQHHHMSQTLDDVDTSLAASSKPFSHASQPTRPSATASVSVSYRKACANDSFPLCENAFNNASKSNNASYVSKDQILLMIAATISGTAKSPTSTSNTTTAAYTKTLSSYPDTTVPKALEYVTSLPMGEKVTLQQQATKSSSSSTSLPSPSPSTSAAWPSSSHHSSSSLPAFATVSLYNNCLMAFIGELLLHQC